MVQYKKMEKILKGRQVYENLRLRQRKFVGKETGDEYFVYVLKYDLRGHEQTVTFKTPARGGYSVIKDLFADIKKLYLMREVKDDDGMYVSYFCVGFDEDGNMYDFQISPRTSTDASVLRNILRIEDAKEAESRKLVSEAGFEDEEDYGEDNEVISDISEDSDGE